MSAVARAMNVERSRQSAENQLASAPPVGRWGAPIWAAEELVVTPKRESPDALALEVRLRAFLCSGG